MKIPRNNFKIGSFYTNEQLMKYFNKLVVCYKRDLPHNLIVLNLIGTVAK